MSRAFFLALDGLRSPGRRSIAVPLPVRRAAVANVPGTRVDCTDPRCRFVVAMHHIVARTDCTIIG
ncbi:hypothetical protein [Kitasatospora herbaricolor]|uniref:hypothetical protein n=1 Tax=Kitasatospora herbaricolor TaxID=68217 RepID=UPI0036DDF56F